MNDLEAVENKWCSKDIWPVVKDYIKQPVLFLIMKDNQPNLDLALPENAPEDMIGFFKFKLPFVPKVEVVEKEETETNEEEENGKDTA